MNHPNKYMMYIPMEQKDIAIVEASTRNHEQEKQKLRAERRGLEDHFGTRKASFNGYT